MSSLAGKRKKKVPINPNPLFTMWLKEWRDEAANKGIKTQYSYNKALSSLKRYPVPLTSGKECKILSHFGDKICKMLDEKLEKHITQYGSADVIPGADDDEDDDILCVPPPDAASIRSAFVDGDPLSTMQEPSTSKPKRVRKPSTPREYIPQCRSGPYALLITLYNNLQMGVEHMLKKELMKEAEPLSEKSFTTPDPGSRYTAWSSMGSLIEKGLIIKYSSPAKYKLTESGQVMATRLIQANCFNSSECSGALEIAKDVTCSSRIQNLCQENEATDPTYPNLMHRMGSSIGHSEANRKVTHNGTNNHAELKNNNVKERTNYGSIYISAREGLKFWYITQDGKEVLKKDEAAIDINDDNSVGFLIKALYDDLLMCSKRYQLDMTRPTQDGNIYAYLNNEDAEEMANPPGGQIRQEIKQQQPAPSKLTSTKSNCSTTSEPKQKKKTVKSVTKHVAAAISSLPNPVQTRPIIMSDIASLSGDSQSQGSESSSAAYNNAQVDFTLQPGSFKVLLCVDNQEYYGKCPGRDVLMRELKRNSISFNIRKLQVGDFLWVAQDKYVPEKEVVLNYIIERKRMDDLAGSITDGRFKEQKFRMHNCGLDNRIYLVESYGSAQHFSISEDALLQAITNTQVIDGFHVKHTQDIKESAEYLSIMTRYLQSLYMTKTLHACSKTVVEEYNNRAKLKDMEVRLMKFPEFNESSVKTKANSVLETFGKQLLTISGLTAEKAAAIVDIYPTPISLMEAYRRCHSEKERDDLLKDIKPAAAMKRSVGPSLSRVLSILYSKPGPFS